MKIRLTEDQIARIKVNLKENHLNEDYLDDLLSKGGSFVNKSVSAVKDFIAGLDVPVLKKQEDVPETADFVGDNVEDFFKILKGINSPITEQKLGEMVHQQGVEAVQIGLQILGYEMPRFGTDGLFGPETAAAINKYKSDKNLTESILGYFRKSQLLEMNMVTLKSTSYSNVKFDNDATKNDTVNQALLDDINKAGAAVGVVATITTARATTTLTITITIATAPSASTKTTVKASQVNSMYAKTKEKIATVAASHKGKELFTDKIELAKKTLSELKSLPI
jgi:hypothetical protein